MTSTRALFRQAPLPVRQPVDEETPSGPVQIVPLHGAVKLQPEPRGNAPWSHFHAQGDAGPVNPAMLPQTASASAGEPGHRMRVGNATASSTECVLMMRRIARWYRPGVIPVSETAPVGGSAR